jgi:phosphoribosylanthranilate isomerase
MKLKVCGMRDATNIQELLALQPDFVGFIFYDKSSRFVGEVLDEELLKLFPKTTKKVGVFVNATMEHIVKMVKKYDLDLVQLHGEETPDYCRSLRSKGINIIKAFALDNDFALSRFNNYKPHVDYFLFDAKGQERGGNGITFDWDILSKYDNTVPYFLAGGIEIEHLSEIKKILPQPYCIDINSKFEISPALKEVEKIKNFRNRLSGHFQKSDTNIF